jgi:hypothetical protein
MLCEWVKKQSYGYCEADRTRKRRLQCHTLHSVRGSIPRSPAFVSGYWLFNFYLTENEKMENIYIFGSIWLKCKVQVNQRLRLTGYRNLKRWSILQISTLERDRIFCLSGAFPANIITVKYKASIATVSPLNSNDCYLPMPKRISRETEPLLLRGRSARMYARWKRNRPSDVMRAATCGDATWAYRGMKPRARQAKHAFAHIGGNGLCADGQKAEPARPAAMQKYDDRLRERQREEREGFRQ